MFTLNNKDYDETTLSNKGKAIYQKLIKLGEQKSDLDIIVNYWTSQLQSELPKEEPKEELKEVKDEEVKTVNGTAE
jgi:hypothetical protein|tara:strand:- start:381 stop:608 length:228 start_codon:yes stop_codon:yes gene_type:complete